MQYLIMASALILAVIIIIFLTTRFSYTRAIEDGKKLLNSGRTKEALTFFKKLVNKKADKPSAHFFLAESYYKNKEYEWALTEFNKVESFSKDKYKFFEEKSLHEKLADLYLKFGQTSDAQKSLLSVLEISPGDYLTHIKIGDMFLNRSLFDNALSYYQKALSIKDNGAEALLKCGEVFYHKKNYTQALGYLKGAVKYRPALVKANYYIGMIYNSMENFAKAISEFEISSQNKDVRVKSLYYKGICLTKLNEPHRAIDSYEKALKSVKDDETLEENSKLVLSLRYNLAEVYEDKKNIMKALEQWEKISEQNPEYKDVPEKIKMYLDIKLDDRLKDFLTSSENNFEEICKKIISVNNQNIVEQLETNNNEYFEAIVETKESEWVKSKPTRSLIQLYRRNEPIGEELLRDLVEKIKRSGVSEALIYSSSGFTTKANEFAQTRPFTLFNRKLLIETLNKINWSENE